MTSLWLRLRWQYLLALSYFYLALAKSLNRASKYFVNRGNHVSERRKAHVAELQARVDRATTS